ncbi:MAG: Wzy polymerase domain-containing protein [Pseudomonadota bacterium]
MLTETASGRSGLAYISLAAIGLMWTLPFLYYQHGLPITTFYQEWGAAMLGLCGMLLLLTRRYWLQPEIPRIVLLPIILMLLVLLQALLGRMAYFSHALLTSLYLLWAGLLMMLGQRLRREFDLPTLVVALAAILLAGAELGTLAGILQHYRWPTLLNQVVAGKAGTTVVGNMGQPNHFANYTTLGLISLGLLHVRGKLGAWLVAILAAPMLFVLVLSGSRSVWVYLAALCGLAYLWQRGNKPMRRLLVYCVLLLVGFGLMHLLAQVSWMAGVNGNQTTLDRFASQVGSSSIRLHIWYEAWLIFKQFPLLGAGFGQFAYQHFLLGPQLHATYIYGLYNNAHNLVMQTAAEMGLAGLLAWLGTLALWIRQAARAPRTVDHWWGYAILAVLGIHSLLEYPLWYAYFIGIAALLLGVFDNTTFRLELRNAGRLSVASILLLGALSLTQLWQSYRALEHLRALRPTSATDTVYTQRIREGLVAAHAQALLQPYAELVMSSLIEAGTEHLAEKRALNENAMRFVPIGSVVYRQALLLALAGDLPAAQLQIERAIWAFPTDFPLVREQLRTLAQKDPLHFSALLEFALRKNEEYQLAIRTR